MNDDMAERLIRAVESVAEELRLTRVQNETCAGAKINEFNLAQIEAMTGGGVVRASAIIADPSARPRKLS